MGAFSIWHWLIFMSPILLALIIFPFVKILPRAGIHPLVSLVAIFPIGGIVLMWVLALKKWPGDDRGNY